MSRTIDKLLARAALDDEFKQRLFDDRLDAIQSSGLDLNDAQRDLLLGITDQELQTAIDKTRVPNRARRLFMKGATYTAVGIVCGFSAVLFPNSGVMKEAYLDASTSPFSADFSGSASSLGSSDKQALAMAFMELVNAERKAWNDANPGEPPLDKIIVDPLASQYCSEYLEDTMSGYPTCETLYGCVLERLGVPLDQGTGFTAERYNDASLLMEVSKPSHGSAYMSATYTHAGIGILAYDARWAVVLYRAQ